MKKLTAGIFAAILTVVGTNAADAAIASKGYVDQHIENAEVHVTATEKQTWSGKQDALNQAGLDAVASGITSEKVDAYDGHVADANIHVTAEQKTTWDNKLDAADLGDYAKTADVNTSIQNAAGTTQYSIDGSYGAGTIGTALQDVEEKLDETLSIADQNADAITTLRGNTTISAEEATNGLTAGADLAANVIAVAAAAAGAQDTADAANTAATNAATAAGEAKSAADAAQEDANANTEKLNDLAWLLKNPGECTNAGWKCALVIGEGGQLAWEVIERSTKEVTESNGALNNNVGTVTTAPSVAG